MGQFTPNPERQAVTGRSFDIGQTPTTPMSLPTYGNDILASFCYDVNYIIAKGNTLVSLQQENETLVVLRLRKYNEHFILAICHDYDGKERRIHYLAMNKLQFCPLLNIFG